MYTSSLKDFVIRLLFVLPILVLGIVAFRKYRKTEHWPFAWGFVFFALFTFFFELVPYLPSFGGYVRYGVGAILTLIGGKALIRALNTYVARKKQEQDAPQEQRKQDIVYEKALKSMSLNQCPSCERGVANKDGYVDNFCMHCGLTLYKNCQPCGHRHSAFYPYCPACGVSGGDGAANPTSVAPPTAN